jgi:hypothetical protein
MIRVQSRKSRECCRHAAACGEKAKQTHDPERRMFWKEREDVWLNLAQSYEFSAQIWPVNDVGPSRLH